MDSYTVTTKTGTRIDTHSIRCNHQLLFQNEHGMRIVSLLTKNMVFHDMISSLVIENRESSISSRRRSIDESAGWVLTMVTPNGAICFHCFLEKKHEVDIEI